MSVPIGISTSSFTFLGISWKWVKKPLDSLFLQLFHGSFWNKLVQFSRSLSALSLLSSEPRTPEKSMGSRKQQESFSEFLRPSQSLVVWAMNSRPTWAEWLHWNWPWAVLDACEVYPCWVFFSPGPAQNRKIPVPVMEGARCPQSIS